MVALSLFRGKEGGGQGPDIYKSEGTLVPNPIINHSPCITYIHLYPQSWIIFDYNPGEMKN